MVPSHRSLIYSSYFKFGISGCHLYSHRVVFVSDALRWKGKSIPNWYFHFILMVYLSFSIHPSDCCKLLICILITSDAGIYWCYLTIYIWVIADIIILLVSSTNKLIRSDIPDYKLIYATFIFIFRWWYTKIYYSHVPCIKFFELLYPFPRNVYLVCSQIFFVL